MCEERIHGPFALWRSLNVSWIRTKKTCVQHWSKDCVEAGWTKPTHTYMCLYIHVLAVNLVSHSIASETVGSLAVHVQKHISWGVSLSNKISSIGSSGLTPSFADNTRTHSIHRVFRFLFHHGMTQHHGYKKIFGMTWHNVMWVYCHTASWQKRKTDEPHA